MTDKQDALVEVVDIIRRHALSIDDISAALKGGTKFREEKSAGVLSRIFGYIGGIFVFAGMGVFASMVWDDIGAWGRILITLGAGFCVFVMGVLAAREERFQRAATPLFLVAAFLQPGGIIVALKEFSRGGDPVHGLLFMLTVMTIQQGLVFIALRRTVLALTSIFFGASAFFIAFDLMGVPARPVAFVMGLSISLIAWALGNSRHAAIAPVHYLFGSIMALSVLFDWIDHTPFEILFLGASCLCIYVSTVARSRMLLFVGTASTIGFISYFSAQHFTDVISWPVVLMLMGLVMIGLSALAVKINKKYIRQG